MGTRISLKKTTGQEDRRSEMAEALIGVLNDSSGTASFESSVGGISGDTLGLASDLGRVFEGNDFNFDKIKNPAGLAMATFAANLGTGSHDYMKQYSTESSVKEGLAFSLDNGFESVYSPESFDNQILGKYRMLSTALNYNLGRQGAAMEMMYRTVAVSPDQGGVHIDVPNLFIQNILERSMNGSPTDFGFRRVLDASIDPSILGDEGVELIPQYTTDTAKNFVEVAVSGTWIDERLNRSVTTGWLRTNRDIDIVSIGHLDRVERVGNPDFTDALDRSVGIKSLLMDIKGVKFAWPVERQPYTRYQASVEHGARRMIMDYKTRSLTITKDTLDEDGNKPTGAWFDLIVDNELQVRLRGSSSGDADVELGTVNLKPTVDGVALILDKNGEMIDLNDSMVAPIIAAIEAATIPGWQVDARVTNSNLRHIGMLINHRATKEIMVTRTRSPFFYAFPKTEERDTSPAEHLSAVVQTYTNNLGIDHMIGYHARVMAQTGGVRGAMTRGNFEDNSLTIEGIARHIVNPYIAHFKLNVRDILQSTETKYNLENAMAAVVNYLRMIAFDILQNTNIENAARMLDGGEIKHKLKFGIVTSKELECFMTVSGDSRTLGAGLDYQIESDVNERLKGKMYMGIIRDGVPGNEVDLLSNGVCLQTPTLVTETTSWRHNRNVNELLVQPRFAHYQLLPIMVRIDVEGVEELLAQLTPFRVESDTTIVDTQPGGPDTDPVDPGTGGGTGGSGDGDGSGAGTGP